MIGSETLEEHLRRIAAMEHVEAFRLEYVPANGEPAAMWVWRARVRDEEYGNSLLATEPIRNLTSVAVETLSRLGDQKDDG